MAAMVRRGSAQPAGIPFGSIGVARGQSAGAANASIPRADSHSAAAVEAELFEELTVRDDPERRTLAAEELGFVNRCLEELSPSCQRAFYMHRVQGMAVTDIAVELGVTERMVRHHLTRALTYCQLRLRGASKEEALERLKR